MTGRIAASSAQRRMWLQSELADRDTANKTIGWTLDGNLDLVALRDALQVVVDRHEALRTGFTAVDGEPFQVVEETPLAALRPVDADPETMRMLVSVATARPFDLRSPEMLRVGLYRLAPDSHVLTLTIPHINVDDWSYDLLERELETAYSSFVAGTKPELPDLLLQYREYARREHEESGSERMRASCAYWQETLRGAPPMSPLPTDLPRQGTPTYRPAQLRVPIDAGLARSVRSLAAQLHTTPFPVYLAAYSLALARWSREDDLVVGMPIANRLTRAVEPLIGFFANTLPVRTRIDERESFAELVRQVGTRVGEAFEHQQVPFDRILELARPERSAAAAPLVQVALTANRGRTRTLNLPGIRATEYPVPDSTIRFELVTLLLPVPGGGMEFLADYAADLFLPDTIGRLFESVRTILETAVEQPAAALSGFALVSDAERAQLLENQGTPRRVRTGSALDRILERAAALPDAIAVDTPVGTRTFGALIVQARRIAAALHAAGARAGDTVAVHLDRTPDAVAALLATWLAGAAFVPLDPAHPAARRQDVITDAGARIVVGGDGLSGVTTVDPGGPLPEPVTEHPPAELAYVVYTSGSTGKPKGVETTHDGLVNLVDACAGLLDPPGRTVLNLMAPSFDGWLLAALPALAHGCTLVLRDSLRVAAGELDAEPSVVFCTPTLLSTAGDVLDEVQTIVAGGEVCPAALSAQWTMRARFVNAYGPSEASICTTWADSARGDDVSAIGRPIANARVYVLDEHRRLVPPGFPGELYIGGPGVARGYRGDPGLTRDRFVPDPYAPGRMYRTGDLVRRRPDGALEYLGRLDGQVKIRGFRIEPAELTRAALQVPGIRAAAAYVRADGGSLGLAVVAGIGDAKARADLRSALGTALPDYLRPAEVQVLEALPLNPAGKVDLAVIAAASGRPGAESLSGRPPEGPTEERIASVWREVLGRPVDDAEQSFFEAGGHSLLVARIVTRLRTEWQVELDVTDLFDHPTIARLAALVDGKPR
ncbi:non-ribosomal peptide synthetase [Amycolatopsis jejuensis]|uniref:non-ribosomal peptide synthetase n=1 Tax=Amycolatopsis jejuensis TaxID=330084 RepID=UPI0005267737|nr:non-ribosomal peptide synthetase [Amycolatopsis jejuensis]